MHIKFGQKNFNRFFKIMPFCSPPLRFMRARNREEPLFLNWRTSVLFVFWTSGDFCPGFQNQGRFPHLHAVLPVHNGFLRLTLGETSADLFGGQHGGRAVSSRFLCTRIGGARVQKLRNLVCKTRRHMLQLFSELSQTTLHSFYFNTINLPECFESVDKNI